MTTYIVTQKSDGVEITRYAAAAPVEQIDDLAVPFADFEHTELAEGAVDVTPTSYTWTKLAYLRRFTQAERIAIQRQSRAALERNMSRVSLAQSKAADRVVRLAADNARATSALDSLRTASASALRSAAGDLEACTRSLAAHSVVVGACSARLVEVAKDAGDWAIHGIALQDAWPK